MKKNEKKEPSERATTAASGRKCKRFVHRIFKRIFSVDHEKESIVFWYCTIFRDDERESALVERLLNDDEYYYDITWWLHVVNYRAAQPKLILFTCKGAINRHMLDYFYWFHVLYKKKTNTYDENRRHYFINRLIPFSVVR